MIVLLSFTPGNSPEIFPTSFSLTAEFVAQIDTLGVASGEAQELKGPITSYEKLCNSDHNILLFLDSAQQHVLGYLKYGRKDLFFYEKSGKMRQLEKSLCLLDFYVLETQQRNGIGKALFDYFLQRESMTPHQIAYDRPSNKLLPFLSRHYHLTNPDHQPNRFTIYSGFL